MKELKERQIQIYSAVLSLAARGVDLGAVRMQEIATEAGIGKGTLYEYFPSKEALLSSTVAYCLQSEIDLLAPQAAACTGYTQLTEVLICYATGLMTERIAAYGLLGLVLGSNAHSFPMEKTDQFSQPEQAFRQLCEFAFDLARADGLAQTITYDLFQHALLSNMVGYCSSLLRHIKRGTFTQEVRQSLQDQARWLFRIAVA